MDGTLKYWFAGAPTIPDSSTGMLALKYWFAGAPMVLYEPGAAPSGNSNFFMFF